MMVMMKRHQRLVFARCLEFLGLLAFIAILVFSAQYLHMDSKIRKSSCSILEGHPPRSVVEICPLKLPPPFANLPYLLSITFLSRKCICVAIKSNTRRSYIGGARQNYNQNFTKWYLWEVRKSLGCRWGQPSSSRSVLCRWEHPTTTNDSGNVGERSGWVGWGESDLHVGQLV